MKIASPVPTRRLVPQISSNSTHHIVCASRVRGDDEQGFALPRRALLLSPILAPLAGVAWAEEVDTTITNKVYFDLGLCPDIYKSDRRLGDKTILCDEPAALGRITLGLYGNLVPGTVSQFLKLVEEGVYNGTSASRIFQGEYIQWGVQGSTRLGQVEIPDDLKLPSNADVLSSKAFKLRHIRPGTVSFPLGGEGNSDDPVVKDRRGYRNTQFSITTGPGPAPALDEQNVVFGQVIEGMDVIGLVSTTPTIKPSSQLQAYNSLAQAFGDDRAERARRLWGKPLKAVVILGSGVVV